MLTQKELGILNLFRKNIFSSFTIREIMKKIETGSYSWTFNAVKKLQKENLIVLEKKGQNQLCSINLQEQKTITYLSLLEELNALDKLDKDTFNVKKLLGLMPNEFYILIITGSYADKSYTKKSDLDVVVIIDKKEDKKFLLNELSNEGELMMPKLHPYVFTREEFLEMLINKQENYGKEIERKHLIFSGAEFYFKILKQAFENGYRG